MDTTLIARVNGIKLGAFKRNTLDATDLDSTGKEFVTGMPDYGEVTFNLRFDVSHTSHTALIAAFVAGASKPFVVKVGGATPAQQWGFNGLITSLGPWAYDVEGIQTCDCTVKISGAATLAAAA
jgi:hypothetical protein